MGTCITSIMMDPDLVNNGRWVQYPDSEIEVLVAYLDNPQHQAMAQNLCREKRLDVKREELTTAEWIELQRINAAHTVLLGWKNIDDDQGNPIPYSNDKALEFINDPRLINFYAFVTTAAAEDAGYRMKVKEDAEKNS